MAVETKNFGAHVACCRNVTCWCSKSTIDRQPGSFCGPRSDPSHKCERVKIPKTWVDGQNTMMDDTQGTIHFLIEKAKAFAASATNMAVP